MNIKNIQPPDCDEPSNLFGLTPEEQRIVVAMRIFDQWYASLSIQERRRLWAIPKAQRFEAIKDEPAIQQIHELIEGH